MKFKTCKSLAILFILFLPPILSAYSTTIITVVFDNSNPTQTFEYGGAWFDADYLSVSADGEFLSIIVVYADNIPNSPDYAYNVDIYLDMDLDETEDYVISFYSTGDGSNQDYMIIDVSTSEYFVPDAMKLIFEPGENHIRVQVPYYSLGITSAMTIGILGVLWAEVHDSVRHSFTYDVGASNTITPDGDPSDWTVPPYYTDPNEGYVPQEFDYGDFYVTDDGASSSSIYHRFDVYEEPKKTLNPGTLEISRGLRVYYDVDRDGQADYKVSVEYDLAAPNLRDIWVGFYVWSGSSWTYDHEIDTSTWDWGPSFEMAVPLEDLGVSAGDTIDVEICCYTDVIDFLPGWKQFQNVDIPAPPSFSSLAGWEATPDDVALVVGSSHPHGPIPRGSLSDDVIGGASIAGALGSVNSFLDEEAADYEVGSSWTVSWKESFAYEKVVAVGGPFVSLIPYKYRNWLLFPVKAVTEGGHRLTVIDVNKGGIKRCYINQSSGKVIIEHEDETKEEIGEMCTAEEVGTADFAVVEMHYDKGAGKHIAMIFGITRCGSVAASRWVAANMDDLNVLLGEAQAAVLKWQDLDENGSPEADEVEVVVTSTSP